ncbi:hypothetical protein JTE90_002611 [Oedothorax gibbosus]|uniref:RNA (guanine-9-)-methyltransferase domain-containing protein 1 n=1 Tax=Oedothorax gibbosus TaxID=931172 RepID=A0AAV6UFS3_9ARAC|nr:hypothetical protein JTE90_002611 [Oedothorax gibbosus]
MNNICRKFLLQNVCKTGVLFSSKQISYSIAKVATPSSKVTSVLPTTRSIHISTSLRSNSAVDVQESKPESSENQPLEELDSKAAKYAELASDEEKKKKILMILMEHQVAMLSGNKVPQKISVNDMRELLTMFSFSSRIKYMNFMFEKEIRRAADKRKKEIKQQEREIWLKEKENIKPSEHIQYGIGHNTMILRVRKKSYLRHHNQRLANSVLFGQKFIIDLDYDCFMRKQDCNNCSEQLLELYSVNRRNQSPFDLMFCNVDHNGSTMYAFSRYMPNLYAPDNFITMTDLSYLDLYPREKLVYITPFAKEPMKTYDPNAVYIIGGLVDKCIKEPVVLAKAKREGIRAVHLPYDEYLMWGRGNKSLPLNQIMEILLEMKNTRDWNKAFSHVPKRKLVRSLDLFSDF